MPSAPVRTGAMWESYSNMHYLPFYLVSKSYEIRGHSPTYFISLNNLFPILDSIGNLIYIFYAHMKLMNWNQTKIFMNFIGRKQKTDRKWYKIIKWLSSPKFQMLKIMHSQPFKINWMFIFEFSCSSKCWLFILSRR